MPFVVRNECGVIIAAREIHVPNAHAIASTCIIFSSTHRRHSPLSDVTANHCRQPLSNPSSHPAFDCPVSRSSARALYDGTRNCHTTLIRSAVFFLVKQAQEHEQQKKQEEQRAQAQAQT
ncbi:hypothetical protein E4U40_000826 [Claviceps sp. LM458 group G5]|nr:hypothetical protein E4U40_000826 [Claviceps sp. LM458 group G5]